MKIMLGIVLAVVVLAGCGGTKAPTPTPPPSTASATSPAALDNYATIACTKIDQARATDDQVAAIHDYQAAVLAAMKSSDPAVKAKGSDGLVPVDQLGNLSPRLDDWRSFCESKGWVGTP